MLKKNNLFYDTISQHVLNVLNGSMLTRRTKFYSETASEMFSYSYVPSIILGIV